MTNLAKNTENTNVIDLAVNVQANKEILKGISKLKYYTVENFISDAKDYIKAITEQRMLCIIEKVSSSGMSRNIKFHSCEKYVIDKTAPEANNFYYRQYRCLFIALGYTEVKNSDAFRIGGCGMDMVFHTNYSIIHRLHRLEFINKSECERLAQQTPVVL